MCIYCRFNDKKLSHDALMKLADSSPENYPKPFVGIDNELESEVKGWLKGARVTLLLMLFYPITLFSSLIFKEPVLILVSLCLVPVTFFFIISDARKFCKINARAGFERGKMSMMLATRHFEKELLQEGSHVAFNRELFEKDTQKKQFHA